VSHKNRLIEISSKTWTNLPGAMAARRPRLASFPLTRRTAACRLWPGPRRCGGTSTSSHQKTAAAAAAAGWKGTHPHLAPGPPSSGEACRQHSCRQAPGGEGRPQLRHPPRSPSRNPHRCRRPYCGGDGLSGPTAGPPSRTATACPRGPHPSAAPEALAVDGVGTGK
jgi:hypothetical protein